MPTRRSARTSRASAARPRSTRATTSAQRARSTSAPSRATPTQEGREARGLSRRLPDGLRPEDRQDEGLPDPGAARGHQQHHARRVARRRLHLDLLRRPARPRRELALPGPRPEDRQVPRPDRHASTSTASSSSITWAGPTTRCSAATSSATTRRRTSSSGSSRPSTASRRRRSRTWPTPAAATRSTGTSRPTARRCTRCR